jgi:PAS domain S-box-containing protein
VDSKKGSVLDPYSFLEDGGELGKRTRSFNWAQTSVGAVDAWPQSLLSLVSIILSSKFPMFLWWGDDLVQFYNDAYRPSLGIEGKHPKALGQKGYDCWPEIWSVIYPLMQRVLAGESVWSEDQLIPIYRNGHLEDVYWTFSYSPVRDDNGKINGVLVICNETTEKVIASKKLAESERTLKNMILHAPVAMCILQGESFVVETANKKMLELWGRSQEQVMKKPLFVGVPAASGQGFEQILKNVFTTGKTYSASELKIHLIRNGKMEDVYVNFIYQALKEGNDSIYGVLAVAVEVTKEIEARQRIELAEQRARLAINAAAIGTFDLDLQTGKVVTSKRYDEIFGFPDSRAHTEYVALIHPDDKEIRDKAFEVVRQTGRLQFESRIIRKDKSVRWIRVEGVIHKDDDGKYVRVIGVAIDITDLKYLIKQKDDFIGIASHELKTPITTIKGYTQVLEEMLKVKGDPAELSIISKLDKYVSKLTNLINDLLDATKMISGHLQLNYSEFEFDDLVTEIASDLQLTMSKRIDINCGAPNCLVKTDREKIEQTVTNLINNANKFSPDAENIIVRTFRLGDEVFCEIEDFGIGIKEENVEMIFQQFVRVDNDFKNTFPGIGLGLYISSEIIRREGGKIYVRSKEGEGSVFSFSLPCMDGTSKN